MTTVLMTGLAEVGLIALLSATAFLTVSYLDKRDARRRARRATPLFIVPSLPQAIAIPTVVRSKWP